MQIYKYVILGGGVAAGYAARGFVEQEIEPGELCIISADDALPYDRPPLSKGYLAGEKAPEAILINDAKFYDQHGIDVRLNKRVARFDIDNRRLHTEDGDMIGFEKLLITTGSRIRMLDTPGADLSGLHYLRSRDDADAIKQAAEGASKAVIVGGGYIGMEVASVLAQQGLDVTMVFPEGRLMERLFTPEMSEFFEGYYRERGVTFVTGTTVVRLKGDNAVEAVALKSGDTLPADFVVAGIGVEPAVELFEDSGLHLDNGIIVNKYLETNRSGIFAAGDVANFYDMLTQQRRRIEHWDNAVQQGQHAAQMMAGKRAEFMYLRYFFSDVFDLSYEFWGETTGAEQVVHRGDVEAGRFSVWWIANNRVIGAFVMNRPDEERELAPQWITRRRRVAADYLQDESQPLHEMARALL